MYVVTGGAGFIGSHIVAELERRGLGPIVIVDDLGTDERWRNIAMRSPLSIIEPPGLDALLDGCPSDTAIIHTGARTSTADTDAAALVRVNTRLTCRLFAIAAERRWPFVYASSASVYGASRNQMEHDELHPLNAYAWSKAVADRMILSAPPGRDTPPIWAGLRFFNVYGPGEDHKGADRSFVTRCFDAIQASESIKVFRGSEGFLRDWVWVEDCARVAVDIASGSLKVSGIFNVGSGEAASFIDVATACIEASGKVVPLNTVPFPAELISRYQRYTRADTSKLQAALGGVSFLDIRAGASRYWQAFAQKSGIGRFPRPPHRLL